MLYPHLHGGIHTGASLTQASRRRDVSGSMDPSSIADDAAFENSYSLAINGDRVAAIPQLL